LYTRPGPCRKSYILLTTTSSSAARRVSDEEVEATKYAEL
jgi:hypothetical protein